MLVDNSTTHILTFPFYSFFSGRLDKLLYVPLPTPDDRVSILTALAGKVNLHSEVDLSKIGRSARANGYSGADCAALLREAGLAVLKEDVESGDGMNSTELSIRRRHFDYAFNHVVPSVSKKDQARYNRMRDRMAHARSRGAVAPEPVEGEPEDDHIEVEIEARTTDAIEGSQLTSPPSVEKDNGEIPIGEGAGNLEGNDLGASNAANL